MAQLKQQIKLAATAARPYYLVAVLITALTFVLHHTKSPLLSHYHPQLFNMSPFPLLTFLIASYFVTNTAFTAAQSNGSLLMMIVASLIIAVIALITVLLPASNKASLTVIDGIVMLVHSVGVGAIGYGLFNGFKLNSLARAKRVSPKQINQE